MRKVNRLRLSAVLLSALALSGCFDVAQKVVVDKGELSYSAEFRVDAKLAAMSDKKGSACDNFSAARNPSDAIKVQASEAVADGNVVCKLSAQGPIERFTQFSPGEKDDAIVKVSRTAEGAWRIDSSFDLKEKAGSNAGMEGMMQAMFAGRSLSWSVSVPKVLQTNGQLSQDGKTVTWSVPVASAYQAKQSFFVVFQVERPWYAFLLDLIDAIKKFFSSLFGGASKAAAPAAPAAPPAAPSTPAPVAAPAAEPAKTPAAAAEPAAPAAGPAPTPAPAEATPAKGAAPSAADSGPITASFDCAKARSAQEKLICSDHELARLDVDLSAAYRKAREAAADPKALQTEQLDWLKSLRNACSDKACLIQAYKGRLAQLSR